MVKGDKQRVYRVGDVLLLHQMDGKFAHAHIRVGQMRQELLGGIGIPGVCKA
jgi:hypothetical protein